MIRVAGKYYSGALFLASTNPQYDKRLFTDLPVLTLKLQENWLYWFTRTRALRILFFLRTQDFLFSMTSEVEFSGRESTGSRF